MIHSTDPKICHFCTHPGTNPQSAPTTVILSSVTARGHRAHPTGRRIHRQPPKEAANCAVDLCISAPPDLYGITFPSEWSVSLKRMLLPTLDKVFSTPLLRLPQTSLLHHSEVNGSMNHCTASMTAHSNAVSACAEQRRSVSWPAIRREAEWVEWKNVSGATKQGAHRRAHRGTRGPRWRGNLYGLRWVSAQSADQGPG